MSKDHIDHLQREWQEQRPDLDSDSMRIVLRIQTLARMLDEQVNECLSEFDLEWWQYDVLSALRRQGAPYMLAATALADTVGLTSGAMTNRIDRLEAAGMVRRLVDKKDRRRVLVKLTKQGLALVERALKSRFESADQALGGLSRDQRDQLGDLLRHVVMFQ